MKLKLLLLTCLIAFTVKAQKIYTIAGTPGLVGYGYSGDGGLADTAKLQPQDVAVDAAGNVFIADNAANVVRMVNSAGIISTYVGTGSVGYTGDGGAATAATFSSVRYLTFDAAGNLYISDENNGAIRMINSAGIISTYAGGGFTGDNGPALGAYINAPWGICFDSHNNLYIAEFNGSHIRMVNSTGTITTVAGSAAMGSMGDGGSATMAEINHPTDVACDINDNLYICDRSNNRIRVVIAGTINNFAGNASNVSGFSGDGAAATAARLNNPTGISFNAAGNLYIADMGNNRIRKVTQSNGFISTIAGSTSGYNGDDILATTAYLNSPTGITAVTNGTSGVTNLYVADQSNNIVREITNNCIPPTVVLQPTLGPVCLGSTAYFNTGSFLVNTTGYQWQVNKGTGWVNQGVGFGFTNNTDTVSNVTMAKNGWKYRCEIKGCSNVFTDSVTLVVIFPNVTVTSASVCPGNTLQPLPHQVLTPTHGVPVQPIL